MLFTRKTFVAIPRLLGLALCLVGSWTGPTFAQLPEAPSAVLGEGGYPADWYATDGEQLAALRKLEGKPAIEISAAEWRGEATTIGQLKGKIIVLDFWATWCGPCMAVVPKNIEFIAKYKERGVELIGVHDAKSGWDKIDQVIAEKGITYPVLLDATKGDQGEMTAAYGLQFWPTYFVIDREGIIRAAGIRPNKIQDVVDQLLAASPNSTPATSPTSTKYPDTWFLGGAKRSEQGKKLEGEKLPDIRIANWANREWDRDAWNSSVRVIHFVRPELNTSVEQLQKVQAVAERFASQGVSFVAICDARTNADRVKGVIEEKRIELPLGFDLPTEGEVKGIGQNALTLGIQFAPSTIVVDRSGTIRATGLKPDFLDKVLNQLLAEPAPITPNQPAAVDTPPSNAATEAPKPDPTEPASEKK